MIQLLFIFLLASTNAFAQTKCKVLEFVGSVTNNIAAKPKNKIECYNAATGAVEATGYVFLSDVDKAINVDANLNSRGVYKYLSPRENGDFFVTPDISRLPIYKSNSSSDNRNLLTVQVSEEEAGVNKSCKILTNGLWLVAPAPVKGCNLVDVATGKVCLLPDQKICHMIVRCADGAFLGGAPLAKGLTEASCLTDNCYSVYGCFKDEKVKSNNGRDDHYTEFDLRKDGRELYKGTLQKQLVPRDDSAEGAEGAEGAK